MDATAVNLPIHKHPLFPDARFVITQCAGCSVSNIIYNGYFCNDPSCIAQFHKDCAEAPLEINHPSHPEHPLQLQDLETRSSCDLCGQDHWRHFYCCSICNFKVDLPCGIKPPLPGIEHPLCHDHSLVFLKKRKEEVLCELCKDSIGGPSYSCLECGVYFHVGCIHFSEEVNYPIHSDHPLKLTAFESLSDDAEKNCLICLQQPKKVLYHCSICNFTTCLCCIKNPTPLSIEHTKTHKHSLTLFPGNITYTCKVCGLISDCIPYMCLQCGFVVHGGCIRVARVININRHDHRIYFTHHLGRGYLKCGVCRKDVSQYYGAYSCLDCPQYAVHTRCALRQDVWNGVELEGKPEETEDIAPFKVVGNNLISHFSHDKHALRLLKDTGSHEESARCQACSYQIGFDPIYSCEECCFILHEKCANLPMKKRLVFDIRSYTLVGRSYGISKVLECKLCGIFYTGFKFLSENGSAVDVHCGSLSEPFVNQARAYSAMDEAFASGPHIL